MLDGKTNFGLVHINHANFYRLEESYSYWSVKRISVFLCFSLVFERHTSGITVYNHTVNISKTGRSCNTLFYTLFYTLLLKFFAEENMVMYNGFRKAEYRI